jgi:transcriptional regulator with XRE-family HTH domain
VITPARRRFGLLVRARREELGFSQREAARRAGLHFTYWGGIERGERNLGFDNLLKIARSLKVKPGTLLDGL